MLLAAFWAPFCGVFWVAAGVAQFAGKVVLAGVAVVIVA